MKAELFNDTGFQYSISFINFSLSVGHKRKQSGAVKESAAFVIVDIVPDIRQLLLSGIAFQKRLLIDYAVALAAVPVLAPNGKPGIQCCDFSVIIHITFCVNACIAYTNHC